MIQYTYIDEVPSDGFHVSLFSSGRKMRIQKYNFPDTVIWNPWFDKAKEIPDFGDDEHPNMICVESGHVSAPVTLMPGTAFEASQILQVSFAWLKSN